MIVNADRRIVGFFLAASMAVVMSGFDVDVADSGGVYRTAWQPGDIEVQVKMPTTPTFTDGSTPSTVVTGALQTWNSSLGQVQFSPEVLDPGPQIYRNGHSEVVMSDSISGSAFGPYTLAVAISRDQGDDRTESDVIFNIAWNWDSYRGPLQEDRQDMRRVALHEFGHSLGLLHPDQAAPPQDVAALMNSVVSDLDGLQVDDIEGAQWLYGAPGFSPANDSFSEAERVSHSAGAVTTLSGTNIGATRESGEPDHGGLQGRGTVWWQWIAPEDGSIILSTLGSNFDTILAVYRGSALGELEQVAYDDDVVDGEIRTSEVEFLIQGGETYFVAVDGYDGVAGRIQLRFGEIDPEGLPSIDEQPEDANILYLADAIFTATVSGANPLTQQWMVQRAGTWGELENDDEHQGATSSTLTVSGAAALDATTRYRLQISNAVGTVTSNTVKINLFYSAPTLTDLPEYFDVKLGEVLELTATAVGDPNPTFAWHKAGIFEAIATGPVLRIENVTLADAGLYQVLVTGVQGTSRSDWVNVRVLPESAKGGVQVASGRWHHLHLRSSGWVYGAGINSGRSLGDAEGINGVILRPVPLLDNVVQMEAGSTSNQFLLKDGTLVDGGDPQQTLATNVAMSFGNKFVARDGRLLQWKQGQADSELEVEIKDMAGGGGFYIVDAEGKMWLQGDWVTPRLFVSANVVAVSSMQTSTVFARSDGSVAYVRKQGSGSSTSVIVSPIDLGGVVDVAGGSYHALFLTSDGVLWAAGDNPYGQLGDGTLENRTKPVPIADEVWTMAGGDSVSVFAKMDGSIWAMGRGLNAPFGNGIREDSSLPVLVSEGPVTLPTIPEELDATDDAAEDFVRLSWSGSLGATYYEVWRSETDDSSTAQLLIDRVPGMIAYDFSGNLGTLYYYWVRGVNQAGGGAFSASDAGEMLNNLPEFTVQPVDVATQAGGQVWLTVEVSATPTASLRWEMKAPDGEEWTILTDGDHVTGAGSSTLSLVESGMTLNGVQLRCVATNFVGATISAIATLQFDAQRAVIDAASGSNLVVYVTDDGSLWARGDNAFGQLGDGTKKRTALPVKMLDDVVAVDVLGWNTVILRADGTLWLRSRDAADLDLGDDSATDDRPFQVAENVVRMEAGASFVLYQDRQGRLWIAGNDVFAVGTEAVTLAEPRMVAEQVVDFDASWYYAAYVTASGDLWVGGLQSEGRLGNGVVSDDYSNGPVKLAQSVAQCATSGSHTFFIKQDGTLWGAGRLLSFSQNGAGVGLEPTLIAEDIKQMSVGSRHMLYRTLAGELGGFGTDNFGTLGPDVNGFTLPRLLGFQAKRFAAGQEASLLIDDQGTLWGFGRNDFNMLVAGSAFFHDTPTIVAAGAGFTGGSAVMPLASINTETDHIQLGWTPGRGDLAYTVWHSLESNFGSASKLVSNWHAPVYYDYAAVGGVDNFYWVTAESIDGTLREPVPVLGQREVSFPIVVSPDRAAIVAVGETVELQITSDTAWSLAADVSWLSPSIHSGFNNALVTVVADFNDTESERVGQVTINDQIVTITQAANRTQGPEFIRQPASHIGSAGNSVTFSVAVLGLPRPTMQWFLNGELLSGEVGEGLSLTDLSQDNEGEYSVVATNEFGSATSQVARLTLYDEGAEMQASHVVTSMPPLPGEPLTIANQISFPAGLSELRWTTLMPDGWVLMESSNDEAATMKPSTGDSSLIEWQWNNPTGEILSFTYTLRAPDDGTTMAELIAYIETVRAGDYGAVLASPDPLELTIRPAFHAADISRDWRFSLTELLRMIELYNTRSGTTRTGGYRLDQSTEDGFAPHADSQGLGDGHHSADTDTNGRFSLSELLRVIELYNHRSGTTRTGSYRATQNTEDGFEAGE